MAAEVLEQRALLTQVTLMASRHELPEVDAAYAVIRVQADEPVLGRQTVDLEVSGQSITPEDFQLLKTTLEIADGGTFAETRLYVSDDSLVEYPWETLTLRMVNPSGGLTIDQRLNRRDFTFIDDDLATLSLGGGTVSESAGTIQFTASLSQPVDTEIEAVFSTSNATALAPADFEALEGHVIRFPAGVQHQTISVPLADDDIIEADENLLGRIESLSSAGRRVQTGSTTLTRPEVSSESVWNYQTSPDGRYVVFQATLEQGGLGLYSTPVGGGPVTRLTDPLPAGGLIQEFRITPDSRHLIYGAHQRAADIAELFSVPIVGGTVTRISHTTFQDGAIWPRDFEISPDSKHVAYVTGAIGSKQVLYTAAVDGSGTTQLTPRILTGSRRITFRFAGNDHLVFQTDLRQRGIDEIFGVTVTGGEPIPLNSELAFGSEVAEFDVADSTVVFVVRANSGTEQMHVVDASGGEPLHITSGPFGGYSIDNFRITPDGQRVIFPSTKERLAPNFDLYSVSIDGSSETKVTIPDIPSTSVSRFDLTPDGSRIVFLSAANGSLSERIYSADIGGGEATPLTPDIGIFGDLPDYEISPDSSTVVYRADANVNGRTELFSVSVSGGTITTLTPDPQSAFPIVHQGYMVTHSNRAVFTIRDGDVTHFLSAALDGSDVQTLMPSVPFQGSINNLVNSFEATGDGRVVVYAARQLPAQQFELFTVAADGGQPQKLNPETQKVNGAVERYEVGPDGNTVFVLGEINRIGAPELYSVDSEFGGRRRLNGDLVEGGEVIDFRVSSDTRWVVYLARQENEPLRELYSTNLQTGENKRLSLDLGSAGGVINDFQISPTADRVVYRYYNNGTGHNLMSVPLTGGPGTLLNTLRDNDVYVQQFEFTPDGQTVVYLANQDEDYVGEVYAVAVTGGPTTKLNPSLPVDGDVSDFVVSPDGQHVVYFADQLTDDVVEAFSVPIGGGSSQRMNADLASGTVEDLVITPDGQRVLFRARHQSTGEIELHSTAIAGGLPFTLNPPLPDRGAVTQFAVTPDGSSVVYAATQVSLGTLDLYSVPSTGGPVQKLSAEADYGGVREFEITSDGTRVVYRADHALTSSRVYQVFSVPVTGGVPVRLNQDLPPWPVNGAVYEFAVSPDGRSVVYRADAYEDNYQDFYNVSIEGGPSTRLSFTVPENGVQFARATNRVVFKEQEDLISVPLEILSTAEILDDDSLTPDVTSPVGRISDSQPHLQWKRVTGATWYRFQLQKLGDSIEVITDQRQTDFRHQVSSPLGIGRYRLWTQAWFSDGSPTEWEYGDFQVHTPPALAELPERTGVTGPDVVWTPVDGATQYRIYFSNLTTLQHGIVDDYVTGTAFHYSTELPFGRYRVWAQAVGADGYHAGWSNSAEFSISPFLVSPLIPTSNQRPVFQWTSLPQVGTYQLLVMHRDQVAINETGLTGTRWTPVQKLANGDYRWWVRPFTSNGRAGAWSATGTFNVGGRTEILSPAALDHTGIPDITWQAVDGAASYELFLYDDDSAATVISQGGLAEPAFVPLPLREGNYSVWVRAYTAQGVPGFWSRRHRFTVRADFRTEVLPDRPVTPTFEQRPQFHWQADSSAVTFDLILSNGIDVIRINDIAQPAWQPEESLSSQRVWSWWVRGRDAIGRAGPWSVESHADLSARAVLFPVTGSPTPRPVLQWSPVIGATRYVLQLNRISTNEVIIREDNLADSTFAVVTPLTAGEYRVWVRAVSDDQPAPWSLPLTYVVN